MKNKIFQITFLILCLISIFFSNSMALYNSSFKFEESEKIKQEVDSQLNEKATIIGEVKVAMTCVPEPLEGAKVFAIRMIPLGWIYAKYQAITNINGEYQIEINPGFYRIFVKEKGYLQFNPFLFYLVKVESGQIYNCSFIVREGGFLI